MFLRMKNKGQGISGGISHVSRGRGHERTGSVFQRGNWGDVVS